MLYRLIAARDGNILHEVGQLDDPQKAEAWAFRRIVETFELQPDDYFDFVELCGDTDGVRLEAAS